MLGHGRQDVDGQPVGLGHIASDKVRAALHQVGDESNVAGQPVKAGNQQGSATLPTLFEGGEELRPVRMPASALDLGELGHERAAVHLAGNGLALRIEAEATSALAIRGDTVIGDERGQGSGHVQILNVGFDLYDWAFICKVHYNVIH